MKKIIFYFFIHLFFFSFCQAQSSDKPDMPKNGRAGACYAKCLIEKKQTETESEEEPEEPKKEWREVLCDNRVTSPIIKSIALQLEKEGFFNTQNYPTDILGKELKAAMATYQQKYHLPIGNLNIETLEALGIHF